MRKAGFATLGGGVDMCACVVFTTNVCVSRVATKMINSSKSPLFQQAPRNDFLRAL
jgi:hypothetical protein